MPPVSSPRPHETPPSCKLRRSRDARRLESANPAKRPRAEGVVAVLRPHWHARRRVAFTSDGPTASYPAPPSVFRRWRLGRQQRRLRREEHSFLPLTFLVTYNPPTAVSSFATAFHPPESQ
uniref:Uncharacterized protein n=1 Tax=Mycena chlorophos TaxID=658473 RepID=A0ABQ0L544_MYCCL|nr:predicted protein [Mycena chlorophos]